MPDGVYKRISRVNKRGFQWITTGNIFIRKPGIIKLLHCTSNIGQVASKSSPAHEVRAQIAHVLHLLIICIAHDVIWFDFSFPGKNGKGRDDWGSEDLLKMVRQLQPNIIVDDRLDL